MKKPRIRIPYRRLALRKGYCSLAEASAFDRWIEALRIIAWGS
jgi:hypothetical protein